MISWYWLIVALFVGGLLGLGLGCVLAAASIADVENNTKRRTN